MGRVIVLDDMTEQKKAEAHATLFYELSAKGDKSKRIPMVLIYRAFDEMIIEVNRSFLLGMGFERMKLLGRTMLGARLWEPHQRADFLRELSKAHSLNRYSMTFNHYNGTSQPVIVSAQHIEIGETSYVVILADH